jgi:hypothetical protein
MRKKVILAILLYHLPTQVLIKDQTAVTAHIISM